jgi:hypothetical protein
LRSWEGFISEGGGGSDRTKIFVFERSHKSREAHIGLKRPPTPTPRKQKWTKQTPVAYALTRLPVRSPLGVHAAATTDLHTATYAEVAARVTSMDPTTFVSIAFIQTCFLCKQEFTGPFALSLARKFMDASPTDSSPAYKVALVSYAGAERGTHRREVHERPVVGSLLLESVAHVSSLRAAGSRRIRTFACAFSARVGGRPWSITNSETKLGNRANVASSACSSLSRRTAVSFAISQFPPDASSRIGVSGAHVLHVDQRAHSEAQHPSPDPHGRSPLKFGCLVAVPRRRVRVDVQRVQFHAGFRVRDP